MSIFCLKQGLSLALVDAAVTVITLQHQVFLVEMRLEHGGQLKLLVSISSQSLTFCLYEFLYSSFMLIR